MRRKAQAHANDGSVQGKSRGRWRYSRAACSVSRVGLKGQRCQPPQFLRFSDYGFERISSVALVLLHFHLGSVSWSGNTPGFGGSWLVARDHGREFAMTQPSRKPSHTQGSTKVVGGARRDLVRDVMTRDVRVARPETTLRELVRAIWDHHVHALPVVDDLRRVLGIVAVSDLLGDELTAEHVRTRLEHHGRVRALGLTAGEIMTSPAVTIDQEQALSQAARVLHQRHIGRLPVVEHGGRLIGIVTRSDLLAVFLHSDEDLLAAVKEAIAAVDSSASPAISATVDGGVVVLQGSVLLLSQVLVVSDFVRRVPGVVRVDVEVTAAYDDVHSTMASPRPVLR